MRVPRDPVDPVNATFSLELFRSQFLSCCVVGRSCVYFCIREVIFVMRDSSRP